MPFHYYIYGVRYSAIHISKDNPISSKIPHSAKKSTIIIDELQTDVDIRLEHYNNERPHSGKYCYGKTPMRTWNDSIHLAKEELLSNHYQNVVYLPLSGEMETGSAGEQTVSDNLIGMVKGDENPPQIIFLFQEIMA